MWGSLAIQYALAYRLRRFSSLRAEPGGSGSASRSGRSLLELDASRSRGAGMKHEAITATGGDDPVISCLPTCRQSTLCTSVRATLSALHPPSIKSWECIASSGRNSGVILEVAFMQKLFLMALRGVGLVSKFLLTLYVAKFLGVADLGLYGLAVGLTSSIPAILGLGLNGPSFRGVVGIDIASALSIATTRLSVTLAVHLFVQPFIIFATLMTTQSVSPVVAICIGLIVFGEHVSADMHGLLISRNRIALANIILFLRGGAWPVVYMSLGLVDSSIKTIEALVIIWLIFIVLSWTPALFILTRGGGWRFCFFDRLWLKNSLRSVIPFYIFDIGAAGSQYVDRFIITFILGVEAAGVFTFFWSMVNAINSLVIFGIIQPYSPKLISSARIGDDSRFSHTARSLVREAFLWSSGMCAAVFAITPVFLNFIERPEFDGNYILYGTICVAMIVRVSADCLHSVLYAKHKDIRMALVALLAMFFSALSNVILIGIFGLLGAGYAMLATSVLLLIMRRFAIRGLIKD